MTQPVDRGAAIEGIGKYRPRSLVTNTEVCRYIDSTDEWIRTRSGIVTRGWAEPDETLDLMAVTAATEALSSAGLDPGVVGMILVANCSDGQPMQPLANRVAAGLGTEAPALSVNATCAGFSYAVGVARDLVRGGTANHVLVIGVDRMTDIVDRGDRETSFIFADGAGAFLVGAADRDAIGPVVWGTHGHRGDALLLRPDWNEYRQDPLLGPPVITMQGRRIFKWAAENMPSIAGAACKAAGISLADIHVLVPHQANRRITEAIVRALELPDSVVVGNDVEQAGNTSSASIPLAFHRLVSEGQAKPGDTALLLGFGGGLAFAAQVVTVPHLPLEPSTST
jgi:3-oxoacyl-[acyl-carrier-protein] synthase-3